MRLFSINILLIFNLIWGLGPIPNPQSPSPIPNPQSPFQALVNDCIELISQFNISVCLNI